MLFVIPLDGPVECLFTEAIDLRAIGEISIRRASHVEPTEDGRWTADMSPIGGPVLGPFETRAAALAAEVAWIEDNHLSRP